MNLLLKTIYQIPIFLFFYGVDDKTVDFEELSFWRKVIGSDAAPYICLKTSHTDYPWFCTK
ncbi:hypothetical protein SB659_20570, partial [Arthrobacter sp. SIMBA_036]|uniref:hypothetical protein n=1 Tax=Arthrobacter sp. SIMBA_036 TaxID=3085778 RepID=UPI00397C8DCD